MYIYKIQENVLQLDFCHTVYIYIYIYDSLDPDVVYRARGPFQEKHSVFDSLQLALPPLKLPCKTVYTLLK